MEKNNNTVLNSVEEVLEDFRNGKVVIVVEIGRASGRERVYVRV